MLFADKTKDLISQSIELARRSNEKDRRIAAEKYEDFHEGDSLLHMKPAPGEDQKEFEKRPKIAIPFLDLILSELAMLYKNPPQRWFDQEENITAAIRKGVKRTKADNQVARWMELAEEDGTDKNAMLMRVDKKTSLHGDMIVRVMPAFDPAERNAKDNYPRFDLFHPGQIEVVCDPRAPNRAVALILDISSINANTGAVNRQQILTDKLIVDIVNGKEEKRTPHSIDMIPAVKFSNVIDPQAYWSPSGVGSRICRINARVDQLWCSLLDLAFNQMHGQMVGRNLDPKWAKDPVLGIKKLVRLADNGEFSIVSLPARALELLEIIEKLIERAYWLAGLPVNRFKQSDAPESGAAYRVKNSQVLEYREQRAMLFKPRERMLWRMAFRVAAAWIDDTVLEPQTITIDYTEPEIPVPQAEAQAEVEFNLEHHFVSVIDLFRKMNPDIGSDEDALSEMKRNADLNSQFFGEKEGEAATYLDIFKRKKEEVEEEPEEEEEEEEE